MQYFDMVQDPLEIDNLLAPTGGYESEIGLLIREIEGDYEHEALMESVLES